MKEVATVEFSGSSSFTSFSLSLSFGPGVGITVTELVQSTCKAGKISRRSVEQAIEMIRTVFCGCLVWRATYKSFEAIE